MSEIEDAAITIERLLRTQMRVVLDSGALALVNVSSEYPNTEALKGNDGQVTVGLAETVDQKLDLTGKIRRRTATLRVNVWATDTQPVNESGKMIRNKIAAEVNRIILLNRSKPNETVYDLVGLASGSQGSKVFSGTIEAAPNTAWIELSDIDYQHLWYSDENRCQISQSASGSFTTLLFGFKIKSRRNTIQKLVLTFEGYGTAPDGNGYTVKVWNNTAQTWQNERSHAGTEQDHTLTITLASGATDFVDEDGYVWMLARTSYASDGSSAATLFCDYACCAVTVNGVTYCDVAGSRNLDRIDIKPPIYRTEFTVKTSLIENLGV
jgi:hypothetical protein